MRTLRLAGLGICCVTVVLGGCEQPTEETADDEMDSASAEITYQTSVKFMAATGFTHYQAPDGTNQLLAVGAAYGGGNTCFNRYVVAMRNRDTFTIDLHNICAHPGHAEFGNKTDTILTSYATGNVNEATTIRFDSVSDYAMFAYSGHPAFGQGFVGYNSVRVLRATSNLSHASYLIRDCNDGGGSLVCRAQGPSIDASTRNDGTDKALVVYVLQPDKNVDHVTIKAATITPGGTVAEVATLQACAAPPCAIGGNFAETATAYNRLTNRFLSVWATKQVSPVNFRGQIFDGTTGATIGGVIDFGSHEIGGHVDLGIASNSVLADNPTSSWAMLIENTAFTVESSGAFSQVALPPNAQDMEGLWSLQPANGKSFEKEYEYLASDANAAFPVLKLWKFDAALSSWESFDVANGGTETYSEAMAHSLRVSNEIAVWSGPADSGAATGDLNWRILRRP